MLEADSMPLAVSPRARVCARTQAWEIAFLLVFWLPVLYLLIQWDGEARILEKVLSLEVFKELMC